MPIVTADIFPSVLGRVVSQVRKQQGLSQTEFAEKVGLTQSTLSRIEQGQVIPDAVMFRNLARQAGMTTDDFYTLIDKAIAQAQKLAIAAGGKPKDPEGDWWGAALTVLGSIGLASLVAVAVAALLESARRE